MSWAVWRTANPEAVKDLMRKMEYDAPLGGWKEKEKNTDD